MKVEINDIKDIDVRDESADFTLLVRVKNTHESRSISNPDTTYTINVEDEKLLQSTAEYTTIDPNDYAYDEVDVIVEYDTIGSGIVELITDGSFVVDSQPPRARWRGACQ